MKGTLFYCLEGCGMSNKPEDKTDMVFVWFVLVFGICIGALPALTWNFNHKCDQAEEVLK